jgi:hypothetical protein
MFAEYNTCLLRHPVFYLTKKYRGHILRHDDGLQAGTGPEEIVPHQGHGRQATKTNFLEGLAARHPSVTDLSQRIQLFKDCDLEAGTIEQEVVFYLPEQGQLGDADLLEGSAARHPAVTDLSQRIQLFKDCDLEAGTIIQEAPPYLPEVWQPDHMQLDHTGRELEVLPQRGDGMEAAFAGSYSDSLSFRSSLE